MFDLKPLDEETLRELREISAQRATAKRKEALEIFYALRKDLSDAFSELEIVVLKPLCETCAGRRSVQLPGFGLDKATIAAVLPGYRREQFRMYDMTNHHLHMFPYTQGDNEEQFVISCSIAETALTRATRMGMNSLLWNPSRFASTLA